MDNSHCIYSSIGIIPNRSYLIKFRFIILFSNLFRQIINAFLIYLHFLIFFVVVAFTVTVLMLMLLFFHFFILLVLLVLIFAFSFSPQLSKLDGGLLISWIRKSSGILNIFFNLILICNLFFLFLINLHFHFRLFHFLFLFLFFYLFFLFLTFSLVLSLLPFTLLSCCLTFSLSLLPCLPSCFSLLILLFVLGVSLSSLLSVSFSLSITVPNHNGSFLFPCRGVSQLLFICISFGLDGLSSSFSDSSLLSEPILSVLISLRTLSISILLGIKWFLLSHNSWARVNLCKMNSCSWGK